MSAVMMYACAPSAPGVPDVGPVVGGDASVLLVGAVLQPVTSWTLRVTEIDFRGGGGSLPGFVLNPRWGPLDARAGAIVLP